MNISASHLAHRFPGLWVALADDQKTVLGSGKTAPEALAKAQKKQPITVILTQLPEVEDEIPNDELLKAMAEAKGYLRSGKRKVYRTADAFMKDLL